MVHSTQGKEHMFGGISVFSLKIGFFLILVVWAFFNVGVVFFFPENEVSLVLMEHVVEPGDTLWMIAKQAQPGRDPREVVFAIRKINELSSALLFPGQVLQIPVSRGDVHDGTRR